MKTNTIPGSSADHTQTSTAKLPKHSPVYKFLSLNSGPGLKKVMGSMGVLLMLTFAMLSAREAKSDDNREQKLQGTWNVGMGCG
jgi:hypothetical protein